MAGQKEKTCLEKHILFSRQPIFKADRHVWGHELRYRENPWLKGRAPGTRQDSFMQMERTALVYANRLRSPMGDKKVVVNYSGRSLLEKAPWTLSPEHTVVELKAAPNPSPELLRSLDELKRSGYTIAIDDLEGVETVDSLLEHADMVKVDVMDKDPGLIERLAKSYSRYNAVLAAKGVSYKELFNLSKDLGFTLFQGRFFRMPDIDPKRKLTSSEISRMKLFEIVEKDAPDFKALSQAISMDASISYRLLLFLNSAAFSFPMEITSIQHAVVILGWEQIKKWLRVVILTDLTPSQKTQELVQLSAQRGKFFELAGKGARSKEIPSDQLFLLGLFSLLETIMDMPMQEIVDSLPIDEEMKKGLCRGKNLHSLWIEMAQRMEMGHWNFLDRILKYLKIPPHVAAASYYESHLLTNRFFETCV